MGVVIYDVMKVIRISGIKKNVKDANKKDEDLDLKKNEEELKEAKASQETTANEKNGVLKAMAWLRDKATHNNNTQEAQIEKTPGMSL